MSAPTSDAIPSVTALHTMLIDSRNGYEEAVSQAGAGDMLSLFQEMFAHRSECIAALTAALTSAGVTPDEDGSFMSTVHRTVIDLRSYLTGLDESVLSNLIEGEQGILKAYDDTLSHLAESHTAELGAVRGLLLTQRDDVRAKIAKMERLAHKAA